MNPISFRRALLGASVVAGAGLLASAGAARAASTSPREQVRQRRLPNVPLVDQNGRTVRFYDDLVRDQQVLINVMYTVCSNICTPATRNLMDARARLAEHLPDLRFISISLTPLTDTPAELRAYKAQFGIDDRWTFLTGESRHVDQVTRALGLQSDNPNDDLLSHSGSAVIGDERHVKWGHANAMSSGRGIARMVRFELS
ncbi:MAG: SCO family protein [Leptothrix sp. (in: b-proteobacteria)]